MFIRGASYFLFLIVCLEYFIPQSYGWSLRIPQWWRKCYLNPPIGCFSTASPFTNAGRIAPQSPTSQRIQFNILHGEEWVDFTYSNAQSVLQQYYQPSSKTVVLIHGFIESVNRPWISAMANELSDKDPSINVIAVDWSRGADNVLYYQSVSNTRVVGAILALILEEMVSLGGNASSFHLVGFSLGAHVAGYAGERVAGIGRITGLDPASPGFKDTPPIVRLDSTDATVVDVYHTDCGDRGAGILEPIGTVDFYLNGGEDQPGCTVSFLDRMKDAFRNGLSRNTFRRVIACSHARAYSFYLSSINSACDFNVSSCQFSDGLRTCEVCRGDHCPRIGYNFQPSSTPGAVFNVITTSSAPFC